MATKIFSECLLYLKQRKEAYMHTNIYIWYIFTYINIFMYTNVHTYLHIFIHTYLYNYTCMHSRVSKGGANLELIRVKSQTLAHVPQVLIFACQLSSVPDHATWMFVNNDFIDLTSACDLWQPGPSLSNSKLYLSVYSVLIMSCCPWSESSSISALSALTFCYWLDLLELIWPSGIDLIGDIFCSQ